MGEVSIEVSRWKSVTPLAFGSVDHRRGCFAGWSEPDSGKNRRRDSLGQLPVDAVCVVTALLPNVPELIHADDGARPFACFEAPGTADGPSCGADHFLVHLIPSGRHRRRWQ